ncbi:MAG: hypothetical protein JWM16_3359 [Verrucomicrobiales bacterium]|nr:hypothetical protein [Verrucomicrobiales bacterium]
MKLWVLALATFLVAPPFTKASDLQTVQYPASKSRGQLQVPAEFHVWIPPGVIRVKALIVHQHGCGEGAEESGETAALDLHWRALADKHDAALLSPHFRAGTNNCRLWCDPRNGSDASFLRALTDLGKKTGHPELDSVPWCLWGHSGGGFWASLMLEKHPERIVAIFCRSGSALPAWEKGEIPKPIYPADAYTIPFILNPGIKERVDARFNSAWEGSLKLFEAFRAKGAPVAFAPDPFSGHDCRNSRLLAIPFFDACLRERISPMRERLLVLDTAAGFLGDWQNGSTRSALGSKNELSWLPDGVTARAYSEYVKYGVTTDRTPPRKAPVLSSALIDSDLRQAMVRWTAEADLESGIRQFVVYRDGRAIAKVPEKMDDKTGFPQFQSITFHDTPPKDALEMFYVDKNVSEGENPSYAVRMINGVGLESPKSAAVKAIR